MLTSQQQKVGAWLSLVFGLGAMAGAAETLLTRARPFLVATEIAVVLALVLGLWAMWTARRRGQAKGPGPASVGMVAAFLGMLPIVVSAAESIRWVTVRVSGINSFKYLGMAFQAYERDHGHLPPAALRDAGGLPLLSWRVLLLPYLEQEQLYRQFHLDEPWDGPHNKPLLSKMPRIYAPQTGNPSDGLDTTYCQVFVGPGTVFGGARRSLKDIEQADGAANTLLLVEAASAVPWTKPADLTYAADQPLPPRGNFYLNECLVNPRGRYLAVFADGSLRAFFHDTPDTLLRPLITWNGHEPVDWAQLNAWCPGLQGRPDLGRPGR